MTKIDRLIEILHETDDLINEIGNAKNQAELNLLLDKAYEIANKIKKENSK